jgi:hypothetical protein
VPLPCFESHWKVEPFLGKRVPFPQQQLPLQIISVCVGRIFPPKWISPSRLAFQSLEQLELSALMEQQQLAALMAPV